MMQQHCSLFTSPSSNANTEEVRLKESKYLMEFTTRKEIVFKVFAKCIIFVQVSKSCPYGHRLQDVQVGSSTLLSGCPHKCWLLCSCRIYN